MNGKLYLIPTPVGNLEDITFRAVRLLKEADVLLAEDTRHAARLLQHLEIDRKTHPHHQHNEHKALKGVIHLLQEGQQVALISDAGTPGISDPGFYWCGSVYGKISRWKPFPVRRRLCLRWWIRA